MMGIHGMSWVYAEHFGKGEEKHEGIVIKVHSARAKAAAHPRKYIKIIAKKT